MPLTPYQLTCEHRVQPLGLDQPVPRLSWKLADPRRGQAQSGYRIRVATDPAGLSTPDSPHLVADTGRTVSDQTLDLELPRLRLRPTTRYHWSVTVWDRDGREGATARSWFETGLLTGQDWGRAAWIEHDPEAAPPVDPPVDPVLALPGRLAAGAPVRLLRRVLTLRAAPARARLYASAHGLYQARLNGVRLDGGELLPGWTDYRYRVQYQTYDVTDALRAGRNVIGVELADGWWSGHLGFDPRRPAEHYGPRPQLIAYLLVEYADGSVQRLVTDGSWRETSGPIRHADLLLGQVEDARLEPVGWDRAADFEDSGWAPVRVADTGLETLVAAIDPPVRAVQELTPVSLTPRPGGDFLADLGQNMVGRVRLRLAGAAPGTRVTLRHAETLTPDGDPYTANLRGASATDVYLAAGHHEEVFEPRFTTHGFRYVLVSGYPGQLSPADLTGVVLHSDTPLTGTFSCSDPQVNQLWSNIRWGQRSNFVSVPTDCPQRDERLGWLADAQVFLPTACYNADVAAFFDRWLRDVADGQSRHGAFPDVAPVLDRPPVNREGAPGWGDAGVLIPWQLYRVYGDRRLLARQFDSVLRWIDFVVGANPDLVWRHRVGNHYGDWLQVGVRTPRETLATAYLARSVRVAAHSARVLDHPEADRLEQLADDVAEVFAENFVTPDGRVTGQTQTGYLLALAFDLVPPQLVDAAVEQLAADVAARGNRLTTGFLGVALLCPVLSAHGRSDLAYALLHQEEYPSWLYSVRRGATTVWERWDGWTEQGGFQSTEMNSFNHYALGSVGQWLYQTVAGIDQAPDSVAFSHLAIRPVPGGRLRSAQASYDSARGLVSTGWEWAEGVFRLDVAVPPGVQATVYVPTDEPSSVTVDGSGPTGAEGVRASDPEPGVLRCLVGSGRYRFSSQLGSSHGHHGGTRP